MKLNTLYKDTLLRSKLLDFCRANKGSMAVLSMIAMVPMVGAVGFAIDYTNASNIHSKLQNTLDAAVLAGIQEPTEQAAQATFADFFSTRFPDTPVPSVTYKKDSSSVTLTATGDMAVKTYFMKILGTNEMNVSTKATAKADVSEKLTFLKFKPTYAQGHWNKVIKIWATPKGKKNPEVVSTMYYNWSGSGCCGKYDVSPTGWVNVNDPSRLYVTMNMTSGTVWNYSSEDPQYSDYIERNGVAYPKNIKADILSGLSCQEVVSFSLEDGGGGRNDFDFEVTGKCTTGDVDTQTARLVE